MCSSSRLTTAARRWFGWTAVPCLCLQIVWVVGCGADDEADPSAVDLQSTIAPTPDVIPRVFPFPRPSGSGYVTSETCRKCHPGEHASWHATYHRTMTQAATPEMVVAPFDGTVLQVAGSTARLERRGDEFWADMVDPEWEVEAYKRGEDGKRADPPRVQRQIVMTTGSHNFQAYWFARGKGRELWQFPWRYQIAEKRWIHRKDVFLAANEDWGPGQLTATWNKNCILCHSTGGYPGWKPGHDALELTQVSELGIACEMCHGRGEQHVRKMESLASRPAATDSPAPTVDLLIKNPKRMSAQASVDVCGRCHSHSQHPPETFSIGHPFRPGMALAGKVRFYAEPHDEDGARRYWNDGTSCSGGREYNGVIASKCFTNGDMTCLSCHSMHKSDPAGQLAEGFHSNDACYQCHETYRDKLAEHTHHPVTSSGSLCYNCHMPYTSFALLKAIRSHRILSPRVASTTFNSQPNACNLCHLDKTLAWTGERLTEWYDQPEPELNEDDRDISAGVVWMLRGDPLQRSIAAWHLKYPPAREAAGSDWMTPFAAELLDDDYSGVRWVAGLSIRTLPGFDDFEYQFDGPDDGRAAARESALKLWFDSAPVGESPATMEHLLQVGPRELQSDVVKRLIGERDKRAVRLVE